LEEKIVNLIFVVPKEKKDPPAPRLRRASTYAKATVDKESSLKL